jgi:diguanylate cyclase (GGDEF)-like protein
MKKKQNPSISFNMKKISESDGANNKRPSALIKGPDCQTKENGSIICTPVEYVKIGGALNPALMGVEQEGGYSMTDALQARVDHMLSQVVGIEHMPQDVVDSLRRIFLEGIESVLDKNDKIIALAEEAENNERDALTDALTNMPNRQAYNKAVAEYDNLLDSHENAQVSFLMLDIDHFKKVNDTHGHHSGDLVLQQFADILKSVTREDVQVFRFGGEEFAVLLPRVDTGIAKKIAERIRSAVEQYDFAINKEGDAIKCTCSVGVAMASHGGNVVDTQQMADESLYKAKHSGRNRVMVFGEAQVINFADLQRARG